MGAVRGFLSADQFFKNYFLKVIQSVRIYDLNINNNEKISIESVILIFIRSRRIINKTIIMKKKTIL